MKLTHVLGPDLGAKKPREFDFGHLLAFLEPIVVVGGCYPGGKAGKYGINSGPINPSILIDHTA